MINILYTGNYKIWDGLVISILSMVKHTKQPLNIYFFTMDLTDINAKFLPLNKNHEDYINKILKEVNNESQFTIIDVGDMFRENLINSINLKNHFTPYAMLRLLAAKVDAIPDKIIYLDTDTIINQDISKMFNIDISNYELGAAKDAYNWSSIKRWGKWYFNSGTLLLNMKMIRETGMFDRALNLVNKKRMLYADQDALNITCQKLLKLPLIYNSKSKWHKDIVVHHFCNVRKNGNWFHRIKPWEVDLVKTKMSVYDDILDDFIERKSKQDYPKI